MKNTKAFSRNGANLAEDKKTNVKLTKNYLRQVYNLAKCINRNSGFELHISRMTKTYLDYRNL
jgi:hypothetical protein